MILSYSNCQHCSQCWQEVTLCRWIYFHKKSKATFTKLQKIVIHVYVSWQMVSSWYLAGYSRRPNSLPTGYMARIEKYLAVTWWFHEKFQKSKHSQTQVTFQGQGLYHYLPGPGTIQLLTRARDFTVPPQWVTYYGSGNIQLLSKEDAKAFMVFKSAQFSRYWGPFKFLDQILPQKHRGFWTFY